MLNPQEPDRPDPTTDSTLEQTANGAETRPTGIASLLGVACLVAVGANLGLPPLQQPVAMTILLTVAGYCLARAIFRSTSLESWRVPLVLGLAGRAVPPVLLVVTLTGLFGMITDGGLAAQESLAMLAAVTFTSNVVPFVTDAGLLPIEHFWAVAMVAQVAIVAPWLLTAASHKIDRRRRAIIMLSVAGILAVTRLVVITAGGGGSWVTPFPDTIGGLLAVWTMLDGLLIGLAVGTMSLASLHRHPTTRVVVPALGGLAITLAAPTFGGQLVTVGLRLPLAALLTATVLASAAIFSLPTGVANTLSNPWLHQIGARSFGLYLWHIPFAHAVADGSPFRWHGPVVFVITLTLSLAAATTTYRSIELPAQSTLQWIARRWLPSDVIVLTTPPPQRDKWRSWDEISLDNLPRPVRRRNVSVSAGRLWQHGDRTTLNDGSESQKPETPDDPAIAS